MADEPRGARDQGQFLYQLGFALGADDPLEEARYLEVSVRPASPTGETARGPRPAALSPGFITLRPALRITPAPTAIHAATATAVILVPGRERRHHRHELPGNHRFAAP